jgi:hypothetical protein
MSALKDLFDELNGYLKLSYEVTEIPGTGIDIGDVFKIRVTLTNSAYFRSWPVLPLMFGIGSRPYVIFKDIRVDISGTDFASVEAVDPAIPPDLTLMPQQSFSTEVTAKALAEFSPASFPPTIGLSGIIRVRAEAGIDLDELFKQEDELEIREEIRE